MRRIAALGIVWLTLSLSLALAQQRRTMTFEDLLSLKNVSDPQISPDGRRVAYTVSSADMKENAWTTDIWMTTTSAGGSIRMTTSPKNDSQPRWSPDGTRLAFISAREEKPQIFLISTSGGEAERLTESKTGVQSFEWSPDGSRIAYVAQEELTEEEEKRKKDKDDALVIDRDFKFSRIWLIDIATKKAREVVKDNYVARDPQWSPDGRLIAYTAVPTPKADDGSLSDIWIVNVESGGRRKLIQNEGTDTSPRWSPDGRQIAYLSRDTSRGVLGQLQLALISSEGGSPREVARTFIYQPGQVTWSADGRTLYFVTTMRTTTQLFSVPAAGGDPTALSNIAGVISQASFSNDRSMIAFTRADVQNPADVYIAKLADLSAAKKVTGHNPEVGSIALGSGEVIRWKSNDGLEVEGLVIYPVGYQPGRRYPTVALIHGGPSGVWLQGFPGSWGNFGHVWAGKGWVVFYPNVRGSSAYGEKFLLSNIRDWGGGDYQDIQSGLDYLIERGISDPDRLAQSGWSYGGYMTAWTITQTTRFKAAMVGAGLTNMYSMYSTNDLQRVLEGYFGGEPWNDFDVYWNRSAMAFIKKTKTPTLILHGAEDRRVPIGQAQELYMGLRKNSVPVELVFYPRAGHGLQEPRHQLDKARREYRWFSRYVLGVEEPEPPAEKKELKKPEERPAAL